MLQAALDPAQWLLHSGAPLPKLKVERRPSPGQPQPIQAPAELERVSAATSEFSGAASSTTGGLHSRSSSFGGAPAAGQASPVPSVTQPAARHENGGAAEEAVLSPPRARSKNSNSAQDPSWQLPPRSRSQFIVTGKPPPPPVATVPPQHDAEWEAIKHSVVAPNHDRFLYDAGRRSPTVGSHSMGPLASAAVKLHEEHAVLRTQSDAG